MKLKNKIILDVTGIELTPGNLGRNCLGNGKHTNIEICCDECDFLKCCLNENYTQMCKDCTNKFCPSKI